MMTTMRNTSALTILMLFAFLILGTQSRSSINVGLASPPLSSLGEEAANAPLNYEEKMAKGKVRGYRCTNVLGVCGVTISNDRCVQLCLDYYQGINPVAYCEKFPGATDVFCYCEHDCMQKS